MEKLGHLNVVTSWDMGEFHDLGKLEKAMNAIIKRRNSYGWKLLNTNVIDVGETCLTRFFLFWEREVNSLDE